MINLNFFFWNYTLFFFYVYGEIFFRLIFSSIFKNLKLFSTLTSKKVQQVYFKNTPYTVSLCLLAIYFITEKSTYACTSILSIFFALCIFLVTSLFYQRSNFSFIFFNIFYIIMLISFVNSMIIFFLLIEVYAIIFYFIFLNNMQLYSHVDTLKIKNMLLIYLLSNFFTTVLLLVGLICVVESYGTVHFFELNLLVRCGCYDVGSLFIVLGFLLKLALPTLHFLKLEIYKYLHINFVALFSVLTLLVNYYLVIGFLSHNIFIFTLLKFKIIHLLLFVSVIILSQKLKLSSFNEFIAYSGFATSNLVLINLLVLFEFII